MAEIKRRVMSNPAKAPSVTPSYSSTTPSKSIPKADEKKLERAIRERAYQIWEKKGRPHGSDLENWLQAKKEILNQ